MCELCMYDLDSWKRFIVLQTYNWLVPSGYNLVITKL